MMHVIVPMKPFAKARPRFCRMGNHVRTYDPQSREKIQAQAFLKDYISKSDFKGPYAGSLDVVCVFYLPIPRSWPQGRLNASKWGLLDPTSKPDVDNYLKAILDCANGVLFTDDSQVIKLVGEKRYSSKPRIEITIMPRQPKSLGEKAEGILSVFGPQKLYAFLQEAFELFEIWDTDDGLDEQMQEHLDEDVKKLRLIRTAWILSKLAEDHGQEFKKIKIKYSNFHKECEKEAKKTDV